MKEFTLDLGLYRTPGAKVFTGRDRGRYVRDASKIDELAHQFDVIKILLPKDLRSINPSFLEEFFYDLIPELGSDRFKAKFTFEGADLYDISEDLDDAIERRLREENALAY